MKFHTVSHLFFIVLLAGQNEKLSKVHKYIYFRIVYSRDLGKGSRKRLGQRFINNIKELCIFLLFLCLL